MDRVSFPGRPDHPDPSDRVCQGPHPDRPRAHRTQEHEDLLWKACPCLAVSVPVHRAHQEEGWPLGPLQRIGAKIGKIFTIYKINNMVYFTWVKSWYNIKIFLDVVLNCLKCPISEYFVVHITQSILSFMEVPLPWQLVFKTMLSGYYVLNLKLSVYINLCTV